MHFICNALYIGESQFFLRSSLKTLCSVQFKLSLLNMSSIFKCPVYPAGAFNVNGSFCLAEEEEVAVEVQEDFLSFDADLVAEQLTYMDAVRQRPNGGGKRGRAGAGAEQDVRGQRRQPVKLTPACRSFSAAVQEGGAASLPGLHLVPEGQEAQQALRPHNPRHHHAVQRRGGLRGRHRAQAPAAAAPRPGPGHPALDRHRSGWRANKRKKE